MQCQYYDNMKVPIFPDFVDTFPDFSPISLPYFPNLCGHFLPTDQLELGLYTRISKFDMDYLHTPPPTKKN